MHHGTYAAWANLASPHSPEVTMWHSYSAKRHNCMSVTRCKVCSGQIGVSEKVAIEKLETSTLTAAAVWGLSKQLHITQTELQ